MTIRLRTAFFSFLGILIFWFLYAQREILTPFLLAGIFAYIINPLIEFLSEKLKFPRTFATILIYVLIVGGFFLGLIFISKRLLEESLQLERFINSLISTANSQVSFLPDWAQPTVSDTIQSIDKLRLELISPSILALFPKALSGIVSFIIFLFSAFFFLKEGSKLVDKFLRFVPNDYKIEVEILLRRINTVFGGYLRGQLFLVFFVSSLLFIALSILGVRFALVLAIFSGIAEIVPIIGPLVAGAIAVFVGLNTQTPNFGLSSGQLVIAIIVVYFIVRQIEDYFVTPYIMGKITKLHPLVILFAVLAGGHIMGLIGLMLAVPVAAILKILLEFSLDKINSRGRK